jgi:hypothetical protein
MGEVAAVWRFFHVCALPDVPLISEGAECTEGVRDKISNILRVLCDLRGLGVLTDRDATHTLIGCAPTRTHDLVAQT